MMKPFFSLLLSLLLLCGCAAQNPEPESVPAQTVSAEEVAPVQSALTMTFHSGEKPLKQYNLSEEVTGFLPLEENLLFFSGGDTTTLTLLGTETGAPVAVHSVPLTLTPENATVQLLEVGISYFNENTLETVVLDSSLREVRRIAAPVDLAGFPLLSQDGRTLYYCTPNAVRCLDLETGISRILKEASHPVQSVTGLLVGDSVLQLSTTDINGDWNTLFLSTKTGQLLGDFTGNILPKTIGDNFFLCQQQGELQTLLFGTSGGSTMTLNPMDQAEDCFFLGSQVVTTVWQDSSEKVALYSLETGLCTSSLCLPSNQWVQSVAAGRDGCLWLLCSQSDGSPLLCLWDPMASQTQDDTIYTTSYYTREDPDYEGLAACSLYAQELSEKYGIRILIYKDAVALEPWDYHLEYEYQPSVLRRELDALDQRLSKFPDTFLKTLTGQFTSLNICIVRSTTGSPESGSLEAVNGIQFWDDYDSYIVLATDHDTEYTLYHELCHMIDSVVLTESTAYDRWENLNPDDFQYDNDYTANQSRDGSPWLQEGREYFIDTYSMSFAREDRARIFEYAMTSGHAELFRAPPLQQKLRQLCTGLREAFDLEDTQDSLPWEQYLWEA